MAPPSPQETPQLCAGPLLSLPLFLVLGWAHGACLEVFWSMSGWFSKAQPLVWETGDLCLESGISEPRNCPLWLPIDLSAPWTSREGSFLYPGTML